MKTQTRMILGYAKGDNSMAIIVNTNMSALKTQRNLNKATNSLNTSLERMSTGMKINKAADDAAGMYIATSLATQISGSKVARSNVETGNNVLSIVEGNLDVVLDNLSRIRDLALQAANGVYGTDSRTAMADEAKARSAEITRIAKSADFNGLKLLDGSIAANLRLQVGANADADANSISIDKAVFAKVDGATLLGADTAIATAFATADAAATFVTKIDTAMTGLNTRKSTIGAIQNRLSSASDSLVTTIENATAARSTIMDADIAEESAEYTKQQILRQSSASLLVQANALPSIALSLIAG